MKGVNKPSAPCGEDEALALAAQGGDRAAAETLLGRYKNAVRGIARSYFLEGGDAEDLVQEGMIGLYGAVTDYRADGGMSFKNFAYLCASRRIQSAVKSASRKKHGPLNRAVPLPGEELGALSVPCDPEAALIGAEEGAELWARVEGALSPAELRALRLYMQGLSISAIAEREKKSVKSCENAVQRAKKKVLALLGR